MYPMQLQNNVVDFEVIQARTMKIYEALDRFHQVWGKPTIVQRICYLLPFSPFRGIVWHVLDRGSQSILDVGCSKGGAARVIRLRSKKQKFLVGVDLFLPYVMYCKREGLYDDLVFCDARFLPFSSKAFDAVLAIDVVEHLMRSEGFNLLLDLERVARKQVVISAPLSRVEQFPSAYAESITQKHKSLWSLEDFSLIGFKGRGMIGPAHLQQEVAYWLSFILPLTYFQPKLSYHIICTKNTNLN
jgi:SAM-dependent methyltransferase